MLKLHDKSTLKNQIYVNIKKIQFGAVAMSSYFEVEFWFFNQEILTYCLALNFYTYIRDILYATTKKYIFFGNRVF